MTLREGSRLTRTSAAVGRRAALLDAMRTQMSLPNALAFASARPGGHNPRVVRTVSFGELSLRPGTSDPYVFQMVLVDGEYEFDYGTPRTIIDLGAHIGLASVWFASRFPDARILAVEAERQNFELLRVNTRRFPNVTAIHAAVWHRSEYVSLVDPGHDTWAYSVDHAAPGEQTSEAVVGLTIPELMSQHGMDNVDLLKVDIEGNECEVFSAPEPWIDSIGGIVIELHDRLRPQCSTTFFSASSDFEVRSMRADVCYVRRPSVSDRQ